MSAEGKAAELDDVCVALDIKPIDPHKPDQVVNYLARCLGAVSAALRSEAGAGESPAPVPKASKKPEAKAGAASPTKVRKASKKTKAKAGAASPTKVQKETTIKWRGTQMRCMNPARFRMPIPDASGGDNEFPEKGKSIKFSRKAFLRGMHSCLDKLLTRKVWSEIGRGDTLQTVHRIGFLIVAVACLRRGSEQKLVQDTRNAALNTLVRLAEITEHRDPPGAMLEKHFASRSTSRKPGRLIGVNVLLALHCFRSYKEALGHGSDKQRMKEIMTKLGRSGFFVWGSRVSDKSVMGLPLQSRRIYYSDDDGTPNPLNSHTNTYVRLTADDVLEMVNGTYTWAPQAKVDAGDTTPQEVPGASKKRTARAEIAKFRKAKKPRHAELPNVAPDSVGGADDANSSAMDISPADEGDEGDSSATEVDEGDEVAEADAPAEEGDEGDEGDADFGFSF